MQLENTQIQYRSKWHEATTIIRMLFAVYVVGATVLLLRIDKSVPAHFEVCTFRHIICDLYSVQNARLK